MAKYKFIKEIEAERMTQEEFEAKTGIKTKNLIYGTDGYLVRENGEPETWVPKERLEPFIMRYDNLIDILRYWIAEANEIAAFLNEYSRKGRLDTKLLNFVVRCKGHIASAKHSLTEILFINYQKL